MTAVFLTVDVEISAPLSAGWRDSRLERELRRDIYGVTPEGVFGLPYQLDTLARHDLRAVFFVESLFASAVGIEPLKRVVQLIQKYGQDAELHVHPEWLSWMGDSPVPGAGRRNLAQFDSSEQRCIIGSAIGNLKEAGVSNISAFRAGNYGAGFNTLQILAEFGIRYDTSYNLPYLNTDCALRTATPLVAPQALDGVIEVPVTFFRDYPGHFRPLQIHACSVREIRHVLTQAWRAGLPSVVIVSHSTELLRRDLRRFTEMHSPATHTIQRFNELCTFLAQNRDKFTTASFSDIELRSSNVQPRFLTSNVARTASRMVEQLRTRI